MGKSNTREYKGIQVPTIRTIIKTFHKFEEEGTCLNVNKGQSGRRRTVRTPEVIEMVRNSLVDNGL